MNLIDAIKRNVHIINLSIVENCSDSSNQIVVYKKGEPSKIFLGLKVLEYKDNHLKNNIVAQIFTHRNQELTEKTKGRGVSLNWITGFIEFNEERLKLIKKEVSEDRLKKEESKNRLKKEMEVKEKIRKRERERERAIASEIFKSREISNKLAIKEMAKIKAITDEIKKTVIPKKTSAPKIKRNELCSNCGGDGGVNGGCYKCGGSGWI